MAYSRESAQELAQSALLYLLQQPELAAGFLGTTGIEAAELRGMIGRPELAVHVLDYLLEDDSRVLDAAAMLQVSPTELISARTVLSGPGSYGWDAD
ncbi:DUF3572 domain-containing protein [Paracoccus caeni]|uniref:DUF3572 domain-containing protein n=2 Tax=Paracoccus caeni TaxID=657651 RepID=A0A934SDS7_9RHOB|nr:DUF3572 domain-containing protein [Paracoccus caeni]